MSTRLSKLFHTLEKIDTPVERAPGLEKAIKSVFEDRQEFLLAPGSTASIAKPSAFLTFDIDRFSHEAAVTWTKLKPNTRSKILSTIRSFAVSDEARIIAYVYKTLNSLANLANSERELKQLSESILESQAKVQEKLEEITANLAAIGNRLDEHILATARKGLSHLVNAANSSVLKIREQQLQLASNDFSVIMQLDPTKITASPSGTQRSNIELIVFGYWGQHLYFGMQGDTKNALKHVYECTQLYPLQGIQAFPAVYFSRDYRAILQNLLREYVTQQEVLNKRMKQNADESTKHALESAFKHVAGAVGGVGGFMLGSAVGMPHIGAIVGIRAYQSAVSGIKPPPELEETTSVQDKVKTTANELVFMLSELVQESAIQLQTLDLITAADLMKIAYKPQRQSRH